MVLTSNIALSGRDEFFMRGDTFLRALDGLFDKESGLVMRNPNTAAGGSTLDRWKLSHRRRR